MIPVFDRHYAYALHSRKQCESAELFCGGGFMFVDWKDDLRGALGELSEELSEEFMYRNAEDLNSKMDCLKGNSKRRMEIIREVREAVSRKLNFLALQSDVICKAEQVLSA
jgi:hypothetical protein